MREIYISEHALERYRQRTVHLHATREELLAAVEAAPDAPSWVERTARRCPSHRESTVYLMADGVIFVVALEPAPCLVTVMQVEPLRRFHAKQIKKPAQAGRSKNDGRFGYGRDPRAGKNRARSRR